jgi:HEPN domain-containing protein
MRRKTREWVRKAENDYAGALVLAKSPKSLHDLVAFSCQQCAEKYLKALLEESNLPIPYIHDLFKLLALLLPTHPSLRNLQRGSQYLQDFAVDYRYPGHNTTKRQAKAAMRWAGKIRDAARKLLGLPL